MQIAKSIAAAGLMLGLAARADAAVVTLTFEGLNGAQLEPVAEFYNGGLGGNGSGPGPGLGIAFFPNARAIAQFPSSGVDGLPSPPNGLVILGPEPGLMNVAGGFTTGFSFFYSAAVTGSILIFDDFDASGGLLAQLDLAVTPSGGGSCQTAGCPFVPIGISFAGTAFSVAFTGIQDNAAFDNLTLGSATPTGVPAPAGFALLGLGVLGLAAARRGAG